MEVMFIGANTGGVGLRCDKIMGGYYFKEHKPNLIYSSFLRYIPCLILFFVFLYHY